MWENWLSLRWLLCCVTNIAENQTLSLLITLAMISIFIRVFGNSYKQRFGNQYWPLVYALQIFAFSIQCKTNLLLTTYICVVHLKSGIKTMNLIIFGERISSMGIQAIYSSIHINCGRQDISYTSHIWCTDHAVYAKMFTIPDERNMFAAFKPQHSCIYPHHTYDIRYVIKACAFCTCCARRVCVHMFTFQSSVCVRRMHWR